MAKDNFELDRDWRAYMYDEGSVPDRCPRCKEPLHTERLPYVVATRQDSRMTDPLMIGGCDTGFCEDCGIAVVDEAAAVELIRAASPEWDVGNEYVIMGFVDLEAVPEDKRHLPFGDDNPMPLILFEERRRDRSRRHSFKRKKRRKKR